jgi:hypothetical protein
MGETGSNQLFAKVESQNIPLGTERIKRFPNRSFGESSISVAGLENKKVNGDESMSMVSLLDQLEDKNSKSRGSQLHFDSNQSSNSIFGNYNIRAAQSNKKNSLLEESKEPLSAPKNAVQSPFKKGQNANLPKLPYDTVRPA